MGDSKNNFANLILCQSHYILIEFVPLQAEIFC